jgi:hypothetical protein
MKIRVKKLSYLLLLNEEENIFFQIANEDGTYTLRMRGVPQRQHMQNLFVDLEVGISKIFGKKFSSHNEEKTEEAVANNSEA